MSPVANGSIVKNWVSRRMVRGAIHRISPSCSAAAVTIALDRSRSEGPIPVNQYWAAYIYVENADILHTQYRDAGVEIVRGPENMPYGLRDFDVRDPDGHVLAFGHDLHPAVPGAGLMAER